MFKKSQTLDEIKNIKSYYIIKSGIFIIYLDIYYIYISEIYFNTLLNCILIEDIYIFLVNIK